MKIINNTSKVITLVNGKKIEKYASITVSNPGEELMQQVSRLVELGIIRAEF